MKDYKIRFISKDGNEQVVIVEANNQAKAKEIFENGYMFDEIISIRVIRPIW